MKNLFTFLFLLTASSLFAQNISVDNQQYSPQELVENILIDSGCIENINVTGAVTGNFSDGDKSYGYFQNNNGSFPFADGIVMSTGKLAHVPGPNTSLSDDDASGWGGDSDLEEILNINTTVNATSIEFDFTPNANNVSFRYIFASEEYREYDSSTCQYSDVFAFLIKPIGGQYQNIAVIPGTDIPVKVTTVHPEIPGGCAAENEEYFGSFNGQNAPINFNGQTKILTAAAQVVPNTTYHIKLIIADEQNYRYDSVVFLEGGSFNIGADLGNDISGLCQGEIYTLQPQGNGNNPNSYSWYKIDTNGNETLLVEGPNQDSYDVSEGGTYKLVLDYGGGCTAEDEINISYEDFNSLTPQTIYACEPDNDGLATYNLPSFNSIFTQGNQNFQVMGFFLNQTDAENNTNPIQNPEEFQNTTPNQEIYARVVNQRGCSTTVKITLDTPGNNYNPVQLVNCSSGDSNSITFTLTDAIPDIEIEIGQPAQSVDFYETAQDAALENNPIGDTFETISTDLPQSVFARINSNAGCRGTIEVVLSELLSPKIDPGYQPPAFCQNSDDNLVIHSGVIDDENDFSYEWDTGETTPTILVSEAGSYEVTITRTNQIDGETYYCSTTNTITVVNSERAQVSYKLLGSPGNYRVKILAIGNGDYRYAVDNSEGPFQQNNIYPVSTGKHVFYVTDLNGCGTVKRTFYIVGFMKFFTPNGDGKNDFWSLKGINKNDPQVQRVLIFNRYGKLITALSPFDAWDGNYRGKPQFENDYWFKIEFKDGSAYIDHFTLLR